MVSLLATANEIVKEEARNGGFNGTINISESDKEPCFEASIGTEKLKEINISFNPGYDKKHPGKIERVFRALPRHEINHKGYRGFNGCPRTLDNHVKLIFEQISGVLSEKGFSFNDCHYVSNALEDSILHKDLSSGFDLDGIVSFFEDIGEHTKDKKYTDFYEAHVKLNLFLFGTKKQKKQLSKYFRHNPKVNEVLQNFLKRTGISELEETVDVYERGSEIKKEDGSHEVIDRKDKEIKAKDRKKIRDYLNDESNWPEISRIYAEEFSKLMSPSYALPLLNHSGKGTKGKEIKSQEKTGKKPSPKKEGNEFDRQMDTEDYKSKRVREAYHNNENIPNWIDRFTALDLLYQSLAQSGLEIKAESFTKQSSMPVFWYNERQFDPEKDNTKHIIFGFDDKAKVELKKRTMHVDIPLRYKTNPKSFPEMRWGFFDDSGSMQRAIDSNGIGNTSIIPWGDNSIYHCGTITFYTYLEFLKRNHLYSQQNTSAACFGSETRVGMGIQKAKEIILNPRFGNRTVLELEKIEEFFRGKGNLIFTISDGYIDNWDSIKENFIEQAKKHNYFHWQIGEDNQVTMDMRNAGLYVDLVANPRCLRGRVIDLTDKIYRGIDYSGGTSQ